MARRSGRELETSGRWRNRVVVREECDALFLELALLLMELLLL